MGHKNACKKQVQKENAKTKEIINAQIKQMQKHNAKHIEKSKKYFASSKTQIAEKVFGHPFDSHLGGVQDMQSRLPGFHAFRFLNLPHMQYVQEWVSVRFGFLSLHQHLNGHIDFQERVGGWHSPPAQVPNAAFRENGDPFPSGWPYRRFICFVFFAFILFLLLLLYCCCIVVVLFLYCFLIVFVLFFIVS